MELLQNNFTLLLALAILWSLPWKGYALWIAAQRKDRVWFIGLFLLNTLALGEIIYLFAIAKVHKKR